MNQQSVILIVDDEAVGRQTLESLLLGQGYTLVFANDGKDALELATHCNPDLVLLDVMMPGMDGFDVCQALRQTPLLCEVPIIMVTSLDDDDSRLQGIEAGADDFITKPFNRVELRARVRTITRLNRRRRILDERMRFEWVVEQSQDGFIILDEHDHIRYANQQARLYLNIPEQSKDATTHNNKTFLEMVQQSYTCVPDESWENWSERGCLSSESSLPVDTENQSARYLVHPETLTSHAMWLQVHCLNLPTGSSQLIRLHNVTAQMNRQCQMWTFHALINHKLGTPISSLINSLYLLKNSTQMLSESQHNECITIATESAGRLKSQLQDIRSYLRTLELALPGQQMPVQQIEDLAHQIAKDLQIESLTCSFQDDMRDVVLVLSYQATDLIVRQVLENARKFHPTQSPQVKLHLHKPNAATICIRIYDDGQTLSPEQLAEAWTPYYQAEKGFSGQVPGMGLGLPMVATILLNVGGRYRIANRSPGPGIMLEITVPIAEQEDL